MTACSPYPDSLGHEGLRAIKAIPGYKASPERRVSKGQLALKVTKAIQVFKDQLARPDPLEQTAPA
ncbi:Uncharacterised protein [Mycobacteroides abscessus subsp. abscessus]|uniref:hypothetical protein n=1 Tax=Mycobacteroides abscessus TaxID=36809 RepID=UPI0009280358|nr:hypothetical protein [Mycobacteroides abscessus]SHX57090.1 Uncharacterised protein [Mycobacteroides abscessus subsp. abscessus]SHY09086.1 Uncharacterised protein [Mycobacteroides abscessus subsp. abscessus]SIC44994.1 Uncharacterised protein [Mycobacteroides abscessus subsp. abscessus]SID66687.1 Uncharacterised protein [Mycobacteroides abscessus subsp. abscessus]SIF00913.1 Uncharacterised protein [Mycobacteroides abscessus subsp. abscessus]